MNTEEALESYINGNISHVRAWFVNATISLGEFLEIYANTYNPSVEEIVRFVKRMEEG